MKNMKKTIAYLLALTCCFSGVTAFSENYNPFSVTANAEAGEEKTFGDWSYVVYDKIDGICDTPCIEVTSFNITGRWDTSVPAEIDGLPVVSIAGDAFEKCHVHQLDIPSSIKRFGEGFTSNLLIGTISVDQKFEFSMNFVENYSGALEHHDYDNVELKNFSLTYVRQSNDEDIIEDLEIPETVCGLPVVNINYAAFSENKNIRSVKIPDTVEFFGNMAFANSSLESVNIPKALKVIPSDAFKNCKNLKSVDFHENLIVAKDAFENTKVTIPDNVNVSESNIYVEDSYSNITTKSGDFEITIMHDDTTNEYFGEILSYTPQVTTGELIDIVFPESFCEIPIKSINEDLWSNLNQTETDINSITFPSGMTTIQKIELNKPELLKNIFINAENVTIKQNAFKNTGIEELSFNGSCNIEASSFIDCKQLKKITFSGENPTITISHDAFRNCSSLEEVVFPENMTADFNIDAFGYCSSIKELNLNGKINVISHAFRECSNLKKLTLNGDVNLNTNAFSGCTSLADIEIDTGKSINGSAFNGCVNLLNINSSPVYNPAEKTFHKEINDFVFDNFNGADDVGFINLYVLEQIDNVISQCITDDMTDMQKIKAIHDWVCNNIVYDYGNTYAPKNHNDASIFMNDSTVCEGYAKCYNLLLNAAGIETYYLLGDNHAWNVVKLGGHYFHSDTTWDDGDNISYDWFLKSDSETLAETDSHSVWSFTTPSTLHRFQKKTLPECKYSMGDLNTDGETNISDLVMLNKYITGQASVSADDIVLADLTYDGVTDVFDLVLMRQLILNK